ncbi:ATP-dependent RNA helicase, putative [Eimeria tenella]|uniref:ATP-dependent RNA helicase, putative n=1 Tax=Eimeria tenella TaxID=5802 RepID=U6LBH7_EIMTE|nr:ATP-dependent RNA helicase, putative [Eimeria tenella]CDJ45115.1 ATP-dependent RNA helicase, putative [Eimeria tenella]|eukprot:XP_013235862.1 ATP-dependent RNA helicase, putative [Eimeria tenella]
MGKTAVFVLSILQQLNVDSSSSSAAAAAAASAGSSGGNAGAAASPSAAAAPAATKRSGDPAAAAADAAAAAAAAAAAPGVVCLGLAHTRELAFQIKNEFERFSKYLKGIKVEVVYGGVPLQKHLELFADPKRVPAILIGTPGRVLALLKNKCLDTSKIAHFVLDECDKCLEKLDMRKDVQAIFVATPKKK